MKDKQDLEMFYTIGKSLLKYQLWSYKVKDKRINYNSVKLSILENKVHFEGEKN